MYKYAKMIYECRATKGWTQKRLADEAEVSLLSLGKWERGESIPSAKKLDQVLRACGYEIAAVKK